MAEIAAFHCPKELLTEKVKQDLTQQVLKKLVELTGDEEQDESFAEYILVMLDNGKALGEVKEQLHDLIGEDHAEQLAAHVHAQLLAHEQRARDATAAKLPTGSHKRGRDGDRERERGST